jgi:hypothetical protein
MKTMPNIPGEDAFFAALVDAHEGLTEAQSAAFNARLVFLLANQIGDAVVLARCIKAANSHSDQ